MLTYHIKHCKEREAYVLEAGEEQIVIDQAENYQEAAEIAPLYLEILKIAKASELEETMQDD